MTRKQITKTSDEWKEFTNTLDSHQQVGTKPPIIELKSGKSDDWTSYRRGAAPYQIQNCPQTLKVVKVLKILQRPNGALGNEEYFDDLASALNDVDAAPTAIKFDNVVHAQVSNFPDARLNAPCADVSWYPYPVMVKLRGDTDLAFAPPQKVKPNSVLSSMPGNWYQTSYLWLAYYFPHGSMDQPTTARIAPSLQVWLYLGAAAGKDDGVGIDDPEIPGRNPTGWVKWEPSDLTTKISAASALRKHLWSAKGNLIHVFVRNEDSENAAVIHIPTP